MLSDKDIKTWDQRLKDQAKQGWENYVHRRIDLSTARTDQSFLIAGEFIYVEERSSATAVAKIKLNRNTNDELDLVKGVEIGTVFTEVFITNTALAGQWIDLIIGINFSYKREMVGEVSGGGGAAGYDWAGWTQCGVEAVVLTTAGTILETSDAISLDLKAACEVSVEATYSNHVKATGGLEVFLLGECNGTYEVQADAPPGWEMEFTQNDTRRSRFSVNPKEFGSCMIHFDWNNTTAGSNVTITCRYRTATV